ncbi:putative MaoC like domain protein [Luminiphilus syltensis NOR5-1B]|uniref:Putative MaoC like domain protein n=1 Tax=Luminiphilus syltensis NOR5-1B TaxID=565045 RepID=B8KTA4_9GAMM|nr:MaoC/PaaZ C-terminal domain-containing protein [Luminiphilus syltensis]EED35224.1 putative MaoC like domain protein [Luminiphilus syltensis NOR5-1B]
MPHPSLATGDTLTSSELRITEADILSFARAFDPQPYHLDRAAGEASIFGGLCASGWQVAALSTRLVEESLIDSKLDVLDIAGVDSMRWLRPTFVDETIKTVSEVVTADHQHVALSVRVVTGDDEPVATMACRVALASGGQS